jgi:dihydroorotate dehydrogenase
MKFSIPTGTSIAKTNSSDTVSVEAGISDYAKAFRAFADIGEYFAINISCPNAFGGESFLDPARLESLLNELDLISTKKPVFIKLAADLTFAEVDALISVVERHRVHGFILSNLTKNRDNPFLHHQDMEQVGGGGISGKPTADLSNKLIAHLYRRVGKRFVIIGVGGIFSAKDAYGKILNGATLVQLITGMIFEGPQLIGEINRGLVELLKRDGFSNISEAVGKNV